MRSVNLIPPDARRGDGSKMRTGGVPYVVLGALGLLLLGVIAVAFTSKQISDKQDEVTGLEQELQTKTAKADSLTAFTSFGAVEESRSATVSSLAESRFDWERVLNELALVIPTDVWLVKVAGKVTPDVQLDEAADVSIRQTVTGPALEIVGCAPGQDAVAGFVAALEDIDGVTRVGVASSERPEQQEAAEGGGSTELGAGDSDQTTDECRTEDFIARFEIVVAFDAVPTPVGATTAPAVPSGVEPAPAATQASSTTATPAPEG
jgi:Tfp pilus assembly protein PilN